MECVVFGTDAPVADECSPPGAESNTEPEPAEGSLPVGDPADLPSADEIGEGLF